MQQNVAALLQITCHGCATFGFEVYRRLPGRGLFEVYVEALLVRADENLQPYLEVVWISLEKSGRGR